MMLLVTARTLALVRGTTLSSEVRTQTIKAGSHVGSHRPLASLLRRHSHVLRAVLSHSMFLVLAAFASFFLRNTFLLEEDPRTDIFPSVAIVVRLLVVVFCH